MNKYNQRRRTKKLSFKNTFFLNTSKIFAFIWLLCVIGVFSIIGYVVGIKGVLFDKASDSLTLAMMLLILIGSFAFVAGLVSIAVHLLINKSRQKQNFFKVLVKLVITLPLLPLFLFFSLLSPVELIKKVKNSGLKGLFKSLSFREVVARSFALVVVVAVVFPVWIGGYAVLGATAKEYLGYNPEPITVSGTGSMHPTFPKGEGKDPKELTKQIVGTPGMIRYPNGIMIAGKRYFNYEIGRGDIVVVENGIIRKMTEEMYGEPSGWVKRIIAMPGDSIELKGGIVYLNDRPLEEPYIAKPRSTFAETFLSECKKVVVPGDSVFLMGDNRKGSGDSREIGFVQISAINHVLPLEKQIGSLDKDWRDTSKDFEESSKISLDKEKYLDLLNQKRKEAGVSELKYQPKLETSSNKRSEIILEYNDFSFEATQSGYTMEKAMRDANYYNIVWGEAPTQGYYEAEELIDNQFQFPETKQFLLESGYQEIGIAEVEGDINGCPSQVIVQHFAGYVPPNYSQQDIDSWKQSLSKLREIQPGWAGLKEYGEFYNKNKTDIDRINEIISIRIANITVIVSRMEANQWLTAEEKNMTANDKLLFDEQEAIATRLNSQN